MILYDLLALYTAEIQLVIMILTRLYHYQLIDRISFIYTIRLCIPYRLAHKHYLVMELCL